MNFVGGNHAELYAMPAGRRPPVRRSGAAFTVRALACALWRARLAMVAGALAGLFAAGAYTTLKSHSYTATAKVLFAADERAMAAAPPDAAAAKPGSGLQDEIEILRSAHLLRRVVDRAALHRHPAFSSDAGGPTVFQALFEKPGAALRLLGLGAARANGERTPSKADERSAEAARRRLARAIRLDPVPDSRVIAISAKTADPELSATLVNTVANEYITDQLDTKLAAAREATAWLSTRLAGLKDELGAAEARVTSFSDGLDAPRGRTTNGIRAELQRLDQAVAEAASARAAAESRYRALRAQGGAVPSDTLADTDIARLARVRMAELAAEERKLAAGLPHTHLRLMALAAKMAALQRDVAAEAERTAQAVYKEIAAESARERHLRAEIVSLRAQLDEREAAEAKLREYERDASAKRIAYETFLARLEETAAQEARQEADAIILSPAERPAQADGTAGLRIAALGSMIGMMGGLACKLAADRLHNTFRSLDDIENRTGLPVIGAIPLVPNAGPNDDVLDDVLLRPHSPLAQSIRNLRTSLLFARVEQPPQVVMFTSSVPAEGKSTTGLLLAVTSAQMGKSTIIVDCDLRRPTLSGMLGALGSARGGLRALLDGALTLEQACLTDPETGLTILPTRAEPGGEALRAGDALASPRFGDLLALLRERFELIILDAPPTLSVTDARVIAQRADASVYCIKWDAIARETVLEGLREIAAVRPAIAGTVVTMVDMARARHDGTFGDFRLVAGHPAPTA